MPLPLSTSCAKPHSASHHVISRFICCVVKSIPCEQLSSPFQRTTPFLFFFKSRIDVSSIFLEGAANFERNFERHTPAHVFFVTRHYSTKNYIFFICFKFEEFGDQYFHTAPKFGGYKDKKDWNGSKTLIFFLSILCFVTKRKLTLNLYRTFRNYLNVILKSKQGILV